MIDRPFAEQNITDLVSYICDGPVALHSTRTLATVFQSRSHVPPTYVVSQSALDLTPQPAVLSRHVTLVSMSSCSKSSNPTGATNVCDLILESTVHENLSLAGGEWQCPPALSAMAANVQTFLTNNSEALKEVGLSNVWFALMTATLAFDDSRGVSSLRPLMAMRCRLTVTPSTIGRERPEPPSMVVCCIRGITDGYIFDVVDTKTIVLALLEFKAIKLGGSDAQEQSQLLLQLEAINTRVGAEQHPVPGVNRLTMSDPSGLLMGLNGYKCCRIFRNCYQRYHVSALMDASTLPALLRRGGLLDRSATQLPLFEPGWSYSRRGGTDTSQGSSTSENTAPTVRPPPSTSLVPTHCNSGAIRQ